MTADNLEKKLKDLGLPLMEAEMEQDVNQTLAEVVQSPDTRHWEAFPVVLAQANKEGRFSAVDVEKHLKGESEKETFRNLMYLSLALYRCFALFHSENKWIKNLEDEMKQEDRDRIETYMTLLVNKEAVTMSDRILGSDRLFTVFGYYLGGLSAKMSQKAQQLEDLSLEHALSQVFSPKQKELFKKKLNGEPLTKTEKEYFSRTVKKKVLALANPELHHLARKLL